MAKRKTRRAAIPGRPPWSLAREDVFDQPRWNRRDSANDPPAAMPPPSPRIAPIQPKQARPRAAPAHPAGHDDGPADLVEV